MDESPELRDLQQRLLDQERSYAQLLAAVEALAAVPLPLESGRSLAPQLDALRRQGGTSAVVADVLAHHLDESERVYRHLRELMAAVVRHLHSVLPVVQARDRAAMELAVSRCELIIRAFEERHGP